MDLVAMFSGIKDGSVKMHSDLGTRDENRQSGNFGVRIKKMKIVTGINARMLMMKDLVIPFNPATGSSDDTYNDSRPFRPIMLVSDTIKFIKQLCSKDADLYEKWKKILGGEFNLEMLEDASIEEYELFRKCGFVKPRVMSYYTVKTNFNGEQGMPDFSVKYMVDPKDLNDEGTYDYDKAPMHHRAAVFFNAILKPEADALEVSLKKSGASKQTIKDQKRAVYAKAPISFVGVTNLVPFLFIPSDADVPTPSEDGFGTLLDCMRYFSYTDKFTGPFEDLSARPQKDRLIDYYDFTVTTPSSQKVSTNGTVYKDDDPKTVYLAMSISVTDSEESVAKGTNAAGVPFADMYASLLKCASNYFIENQKESLEDTKKSFEALMSKSNRFRPIESIQDKLLPACNEVFNKQFASSEYFTDKIKMANQEFFVAMNPANAHLVAAYDDDDIDAAKEEQKTDIGSLIAEMKSDSETEADTSNVVVEDSNAEDDEPLVME